MGHLELTLLQREHIGCIPWTQGHLYKVMHASKSANTIKLMLLIELHHHLSYIAPLSAHKLVQNGAIIRIELDPDLQKADYDACIYAQATRLPVPKVRISPSAQHFGDEIHTDVWGPSPIATH
jgi:hypothetical protein